jgi:hypothetical protein
MSKLNEEYYTNNSSINIHIDNIVSFRDFLNAILSDIKSGEYNVAMIKNLSQTVEKFYNEIGNEDEIFKPNTIVETDKTKFLPKAVLCDVSDSDSDCAESDTATVSDSDSDNPQKIQSYSIGKYFSHKPYSIYTDEPDFLDDVSPNQVVSTIAEYSKTRERTEHKVSQYDYYQSLFQNHKKEVEEDRKSEKNPIPKQINNLPPINTKQSDKLVEDFLNNNLELNNYHYLKNFSNEKINNFCLQSYIC